MKFIKFAMLLCLSVSSFGCSTSPYPKVSMDEINIFEKGLQDKYSSYLKNEKPVSMEKWIQPSNKEDPCKIYVGYASDYDRTLEDGYEVYWDGECRHGYAYGLGREFEKLEETDSNYDESIAIYPGGSDKHPSYFYEKKGNAFFYGKISEGSKIGITQVYETDKDNNFNAIYYYGGIPEETKGISFFLIQSPFSGSTRFLKQYPTHSYAIDFHEDNVFENRVHVAFAYTIDQEIDGYGFQLFKNGEQYEVEAKEGYILRRVTLPKERIEFFENIKNEVNNIANEARSVAYDSFKVFQKYLSRACSQKQYVYFMDNDKYKSICSERNKLSEKVESVKKNYLSQVEERKKQIAKERKRVAELQMNKQEVESANTESWLGALEYFADGLAEVIDSYSPPTIPTPAPTSYPSRAYGDYSNRSSSGTPIYDSSECIGAVVNGRCVGSILPNPSNVLRKKCYGTMINGECKGAVGY